MTLKMMLRYLLMKIKDLSLRCVILVTVKTLEYSFTQKYLIPILFKIHA